MTPRRLAVGLLLLVAVGGPPGVAADVLHDIGAAFEGVARELAAAFPRAETRVASVDGDEVRLTGAGVSVLRPGLELVVYRRGEPFRHPITNQPLGHAEEEVATLVVSSVAGDGATASIAASEDGRRPHVGDGARITAGRMPVAVLPTTGVSVPGETGEQTALLLVSRFSALLEKTGRFVAVEPRRVLDVAAPPGGAPPPSALDAARRLRAPAVVVTRLVQEGRARYLETSWISARTGGTLFSARTALARATYPPRFAWERTPELERRHVVDGPVRGLALADLDGDGRSELIIADERVVSVHRWQEAAGPAPSGVQQRSTGLILSVDAADLTGTGRAQVVMVDYSGAGDAIQSTVFELAGNRLQPIYQTRGRYLRVVPVAGEQWLLAQAAGQTEPFDSTIRRLVWRDGTFREDVRLRVPSGVSVYGLALMRLTGSADPDIVALTPEDRLSVWTAKGQRLWLSPETYGGAAVTFPFAPLGANRDQVEPIGRVLGRLIPLMGTAGEPEVLVHENVLPVGSQLRTVLPRLAPVAFTQGRMHRLQWKDGAFRHLWLSQTTEGYIGDFAYGDMDVDGVSEVVVGVVSRGFNLATLNPLGRSPAHLVIYELP